MKKIGLIHDKKSKKLFLLPEQVKTLVEHKIEVNMTKGYGLGLDIADEKYLTAGAKMHDKAELVFASSDIILKANAFTSKELTKMVEIPSSKKIVVTMANYIANADMIFYMLKGNLTSLAWSALANNNGYVFFPELEAIKGRHCINEIVWAWANKGLGTTNAKAIGAKRPNVLILNATYAACEATRAALANNIDVTILDNDTEYLKDFKDSAEIKKLSGIYGAKVHFADAKFETMNEEFKKADAFINTCINPMDKTKLRVTAEMAKAMPAGSVMIDAACENGYAFNFQKGYVPEKIDMKQFEKIIYSCVHDITDLYPLASSQIVSSKSVDYLIALAEKGVDANSSISNVIVTEDGKVVNEAVKNQLHLY